MFTIIEVDGYSHGRVILRDEICIYGSYKDNQKILKKQLAQIKEDYNDRIKHIEHDDDFFIVTFHETDQDTRLTYTAEIIKVTM